MDKRLLHTPEGVRDIYGMENARKLRVQSLLNHQFSSFGYKDIQTPTFEFFDVFGKEIGTTSSKELYKFFDKEGNTLVLRPDFTPSMARCAAKYFMEEEIPVRFTYVGNTFTNTSNLQGKYKEVTQTGVEYIGDASVEADAELIVLAMKALLAAGLRDFQISIGEIDFFKGICEESGLDKETELEVREQISNKNYFGVEELLSQKDIAQDKIAIFLKVTELFGSFEALKEAEKLVTNQRSIDACHRLNALYELLKLAGAEKYISFDLGMVSKYDYYTGIIFKAYTYGVGDAVLTGGRYDNLLSYFGKKAPAIGFMIVVDDLMVALSSQKIDLELVSNHVMLLFKQQEYQKALLVAGALREEGKMVELQCKRKEKTIEDYLSFAAYNMTDYVWVLDADAVTVYEALSKEVIETRKI